MFDSAFESLFLTFWEGPGWAETLAWILIPAGVQFFVLRKAREQRRPLRWLTLLPVALAVLAAMMAFLGAYASFFGLGTALEEKNVFLGIFSLLGFAVGGIFIYNLLPRTMLYLTGWVLGWAAWLLRRNPDHTDLES